MTTHIMRRFVLSSEGIHNNTHKSFSLVEKSDARSCGTGRFGGWGILTAGGTAAKVVGARKAPYCDENKSKNHRILPDLYLYYDYNLPVLAKRGVERRCNILTSGGTAAKVVGARKAPCCHKINTIYPAQKQFNRIWLF